MVMDGQGKNAVALFEVIHTRQAIRPQDAGAVQKPPIESSPVEASPELAVQAVDLWRKKNSDPETWTNSPVKIRQPLLVRISGQIAAFKAGYHLHWRDRQKLPRPSRPGSSAKTASPAARPRQSSSSVPLALVRHLYQSSGANHSNRAGPSRRTGPSVGACLVAGERIAASSSGPKFPVAGNAGRCSASRR